MRTAGDVAKPARLGTRLMRAAIAVLGLLPLVMLATSQTGSATALCLVALSLTLAACLHAGVSMSVSKDVTGATTVRAASGRAVVAATDARPLRSSQGEFLANVSHEIRTPLTAILGYVDLLAEEFPPKCATGRGEAGDHIATIARNAEHLLNLLNEILDYSKMEAGRLDVERIVCSPVQLVNDACRLMRVRALAAGLRFELCNDGPIPEAILTDPTRLRQILLNLIGNAIKFTPSGAVRVVVRLRPKDVVDAEPRLEFDVIDTGIGIAAERLTAVFEPFVQAAPATSRRFGGTGLGLAISKRLAELLGGSISVQSNPGRGSTFRLSIATGPLRDDRLSTSLEAAVGTTAEQSTRAVYVPPRLEGRVLLAEDGPDNRRLIEFLLSRAGLAVTSVEDGRAAVDAALGAWKSGQSFDVVLMDMGMPVLDGHMATRALLKAGCPTPVVALTAHALAGDREACLAAGCVDYVAKPIDRRVLFAAIQRQLGGARRADEAPVAGQFVATES